MAVTGQFAEHVAPELMGIVGTNLGGRESYYSQVTKVETSNRNYEDVLAAAGLPIAVQKEEGQAIQTFDPLEGDKKRISHTVYGIGFEISEEMFDDDLYKGSGSALTEAGSGLADSLAEVVELQAHRFYNSEAFLTTGVPDFLQPLPGKVNTKSVFNTSHGPISGGEAAGQPNRPSTDVDLTLTSLRAALIQFKKYRNDRNLRIPSVAYPSTLMVPVDLEFDAAEILNSTNRPDTANRVENVTKGVLKLLVNPYIDDADSWFLLAPKHMLKFFWRKRPQMDSFDDRSKRVARFVAWQRFGLGAIHWLGVYGSPGA